MTLSKTQRAEQGMDFSRFLYLWERDLLELARRFPGWRAIARNEGFSDEKIDAPWPHMDEGRRVKIRKVELRFT